MRIAIITFIPGNHILGQSIGCVVPLRREMKLGRLLRVCNRIADARPHDRVSINILGSHTDIAGSCVSIAFHLAPTPYPIPNDSLARRGNAIRNWLRHEFNVEEFQEKNFPSRIEFCQYLRDPLAVM